MAATLPTELADLAAAGGKALINMMNAHLERTAITMLHGRPCKVIGGEPDRAGARLLALRLCRLTAQDLTASAA
jgi:hypothetical protein